MSSDKRGRVAQRAFLSRHLPHSLAHRVAQLAVEFSSRLPTAAAGLRPHQSRPSRRGPHRSIAVAMSHPVLTAAVATPHQVPPPIGTITGRCYAPPIMPRRPPPSSWACSIHCMRHSTTIELGKQLTIGPGQFVEPDSTSRCLPLAPSLRRHSSESTRPHLCRHSSPSLSPLVTAHERCPKIHPLLPYRELHHRQRLTLSTSYLCDFGRPASQSCVLAALSCNEARAKRQTNVFGQALAGSSSSAARSRVFTHPPHPGRPPWRSASSSLSTGFP